MAVIVVVFASPFMFLWMDGSCILLLLLVYCRERERKRLRDVVVVGKCTRESEGIEMGDDSRICIVLFRMCKIRMG